MRILQVHNRYQFVGGENTVADMERELLCSAGHEVERWQVSNDEIRSMGLRAKLGLAIDTVWSSRRRREMHDWIEAIAPDVVHVHNYLPLLSPSIFAACTDLGVPAVQSLHNYRMVCPGAMLERRGEVCHDCVGRRVALPGIRHGCYRDSRLQTAVVAAMLLGGHLRGTWRRDVARYIVMTDFARDLLSEGTGIGRERFFVKPNSLADPGPSAAPEDPPGFLFASRLTPQKGVEHLLAAWRSDPALPRLRIAGDGPLRGKVEAAAAADPRIEALGHVPHEQMDALMRRSWAVLVPSIWYEGFPMTIIESIARGVPVVVSDLGGMPDMVGCEVAGICIRPGDGEALATACRRLLDPGFRARLATGARDSYLERYHPEVNYDLLMTCYHQAREAVAAPSPVRAAQTVGSRRSVLQR